MAEVSAVSIKAEWSEGNHRAVIATMTITDGLQWSTVPLKTVTLATVNGGTDSSPSHGGVSAITSGNILTFETSGTITNAVVKCIGY